MYGDITYSLSFLFVLVNLLKYIETITLHNKTPEPRKMLALKITERTRFSSYI
jgi:hypothetical protein